LKGESEVWHEQEAYTTIPDLVIIGLQEMCKLTATNILGDE
jgi:hypothetical protein